VLTPICLSARLICTHNGLLASLLMLGIPSWLRHSPKPCHCPLVSSIHLIRSSITLARVPILNSLVALCLLLSSSCFVPHHCRLLFSWPHSSAHLSHFTKLQRLATPRSHPRPLLTPILLCQHLPDKISHLVLSALTTLCFVRHVYLASHRNRIMSQMHAESGSFSIFLC
jgi:hypothetical protein